MEHTSINNNEKKLTLLLCRLTFSEQEKDEIKKLIEGKINWMKVFEYSVSNRITTLIWSNLKKLNIQYNIPKYVKNILHLTAIGIQKQNEIYLQQVAEITHEFRFRNSMCVPVKGAFFIPHIYKDYQIRYMGDLDFLIRKEDVPITREIMEEKGYVQGEYLASQNTILPMSRKDDITWKIKMSHLYPFVKKIDSSYMGGIKCDFRFALDDRLDCEPINEMLSDYNGNFCHAYRFIHLCTHLYEEAKKEIYIVLGKEINLIKFCDIREFVLYYMSGDDFETVIDFASRYHLNEAVYYTLWHLSLIYNDGYEKKIMERIHIEDNQFLFTFGKNSDNQTTVWKKDFWDRLFSGYNIDEIEEDKRDRY